MAKTLCDIALEEGSWSKPNALLFEIMFCQPLPILREEDDIVNVDAKDEELAPFKSLGIDLLQFRKDIAREFEETNGKGYEAEPVEREQD